MEWALSLTQLIISPIFTRYHHLDRMARGSIKANSIIISVMGKDGLALLDSIERDGMLLDDLDRHRLGRSEIPNLLALLLGVLQELSNVPSTMGTHGLAQVKILSNHFGMACAERIRQ